MKRITLTYLMVIFAILGFAQTQDSIGFPTHKRIKINGTNHDAIHRLADLGIDLRCGADHHHSSLTIDIANEELDILSQNGISYQIVIDNLNQFYRENSTRDLATAQIEFRRERDKTLAFRNGLSQRSSVALNTIDNYLQSVGAEEIDWNVPLNYPDVTSTSEVPMGGSLTVSQVLSELDEMRAYALSKGLNIISEKQDASAVGNKTWGNPATTISNPYYNPSDTAFGPQTYQGVGSTDQRFDPQTIYYVRITGNESSTPEGSKPQALYTSMIHSRELSSLMGNMFFMWYLLENYDCDPAIKELVDNNELYFIPVVNPDGLRWNEAIAPFGGGMQRKNLRPDTNSSSLENRGVDLNRNFDYFWGSAGSGSSGSPTSSGYRGPAAFSEPETRIIKDFVESRNFKTAVWHHSFANSIPHPYGGNPTFTSGRENEMQKWHEDMTRYSRYVSGATIFPPANGIADDWMLGGAIDGNGSYGAVPNGMGTTPMRILATTPENGSGAEAFGNGLGNSGNNQGFWPTRGNIIPIVKRQMRINLMNAYYAGRYAKFHDLTPSNLLSGEPASNLTTDLTFGVERVGQTDGAYILTIIPIQNIQIVNTPNIPIVGLGSLDQTEVSTSITLNSGIQPNERIIYRVQLSNNTGAIIYDATYEKIYQPTVLFQDNPDTDLLTNWTTTGTWSAATISGAAYSGSRGIKVGGNNNNAYGNNIDRTITTASTYNFDNTSDYLIQFFAKWDIERNYDYAEILASVNGGAYQPLEGKYSKPATTIATNDHTNNSGAPQDDNSSGIIYDGDLYDNWKMEEIAIDSENNSFLPGATNVRIRFRFDSDDDNVLENYTSTPSGFYFDDFRILELNVPCDAALPPQNIEATNIDFTTADITWSNITLSTYDLRYREIGTSTWNTITNISASTQALSGLNSNTEYEVQVATRCNTTVSDFSVSTKFMTLNPCLNTISNYPYTEDFETGEGLWEQPTNDDGSWTRDANGTPSGTTGPNGGFDPGDPTGQAANNFYMYVEGTLNQDPGPGSTVYFESPCIDLTGRENGSFSFRYHMHGSDMGDLSVEVSTDLGTSWTNLITFNGEQHTNQTDPWLEQIIGLSAYDNQIIKLRFTGTTQENPPGNTDGSLAPFRTDMAIDYINLTSDLASAGPTAITQDITVNLDASGNATIAEDAVNNGSTGTGTLTFDTDITSFNCSNIGDNTVILTVTDDNGTDTATATVTVIDSIDPDTPTLAAVTVDCNGTLSAPTTSDNCAGTITGTTSDSLSFVEGGSTTITWTFDDGNGNSTTATQVYNYDDTTAPTTPTLAAVTVDCNGTLSAPTTTDNCAGTITGTTSDSLSFVEGGSTTITWTFDDGNGNSTTATQVYNYDDTTAPITPTLAAVTVDCNGTLSAPTTTDNCAGTITGTTSDSLSFVEGGSTTITWTFDDGNGNSTTATQVYNYDDTTAPTTPTLAAVTVDCNGTLSAPTTSDNCAGTITGTTSDSLSFVEGGSTTITWTFDDGNGNSTTATQVYNYDDTTAPTTPTLAAVTVDCNGTLSAPTTTDNCAGTITGTTSDSLSFVEGGSTTITWTFDDGNGNSTTATQVYNYDDTTAPITPTLAAVTVDCNGTLSAPTTTDNCAGTITGTTSDSLSFVEGGSTTITWTFDDGNGNSTTATQVYNYDDTTAPTTPTLAAVTVDCNGTLSAPTTSDNCAGTITGTTSDSLSFVEGGSTTITWTFDDGNGNSTTATQVYNYDDTTAPTTPTLAAVTVDCNGTLSAPTTSDNCAGTITGTTSDSLSFVEGGSTTITWTFDDGNGNSTTATQVYNYDDTTAPITPTLAAVTVDCNGTLSAPTTSDNCAGTITGTTSDSLSFVEGGSTTITWTFDDGNGNSTTATQVYNYDDTTAPITPTLAAVTVDCNGTLSAPTTTDNCAGTITGTTSDSLSFVEGGSTTITWTFDDGNGNSTTATQVYNYDDTTAPTCSTQDITVQLDGTGTVSISPMDIDNGSIDSCGSVSLSASQTTFTTADIGDNTVTLTVDDGNGNISTCDAIVTVESQTLDIDDNIIEIFSVTPNPFKDNLNISIPLSMSNDTFRITIFDLNGRKVYQRDLSAIDNRINLNGLNNLQKAPYIIRVLNKETNSLYNTRLIKY